MSTSMKVNSLQINAFRGIKQLELAFSPRTTVFVGINGVGKTAILDCLAILFSSVMNKIRGEQLYKESDIYNGANETKNQITVSIEGREITWTNISRKNGQNLSLDQIGPIVEKLQSNEVTETFNLAENPKAGIPLVVYYPVNRAVFDVDISLNITERPNYHQVSALDRALSRKNIDFQSFFEWFRNREDIENETRLDSDAKYRDRQLEAVRQAIQSLMPDYTDLRVRRLPLRMTLTKIDHELIINQLSDGEKCLLALTGDLVRRLAIANPALANPLEGAAIVLIDEIDLHLHPQWQRAVIPKLEETFPFCQFIVSTHSPQVISEVQQPQRKVYFLRVTDEGIVANLVTEAYGKDTNFILEGLMETSERPADIKEKIMQLFRMIDENQLKAARELLRQLEQQIGTNEPKFAKAEVLLHRKEVLGASG
jgi:predicted ATP-binding protein involved in virulence